VDAERKARAYEAFERATELPMLVLALAIIPLFAVALLVDLPPAARAGLRGAGALIWVAFAFELVVKTYLSEHRRRYLVRHWYDVLIVVLPFLRPLRVLRVLRLARIGALLFRSGAGVRVLMTRHGLQYILLFGVVVFFASAGLVLLLERGNGGPISDFGTALWWAIATVTTVGYGDVYPTTPEGRFIAVLLMVVGIALFSVVTANVAALLVQTDKEEDERGGARLSDLVAEVGRLRDEIASLRAGLVEGGQHG
jgi:voltage-gated potassium channel